MTDPICPNCQSKDTYNDGTLWICPQCSHEWNPESTNAAIADVATDGNDQQTVKDANGNLLQDGDTVTVIKDLKVKGASNSIKVGTKVKGIRLIPDSPDGHNIDCKIDGFGAMKLKSEFVKKS